MTSAFENLAGPGKALRVEPPDANEFDGLHRMGLERLKDAQRKDLALASSFDLAYNAAHALCLAALRWRLPAHQPVHRLSVVAAHAGPRACLVPTTIMNANTLSQCCCGSPAV